MPLKKLTLNVRVPFSAIYQFLRTNPGKQIPNLDTLKHISPQVLACLKGKIYLLYGQNFQKVGLLTNYKPVVAERPQIIEYQNPRKYLSDKPVDYASCQWKVNVVLSTNHLSKVLRPEIILEIQTQ